jgi:hypothetical protein
MLETSFCCQLGAILQKDFSKMTTTPPVTERLPELVRAQLLVDFSMKEVVIRRNLVQKND